MVKRAIESEHQIVELVDGEETCRQGCKVEYESNRSRYCHQCQSTGQRLTKALVIAELAVNPDHSSCSLFCDAHPLPKEVH
jgi:hypothetical protein